MSSCPSKPSLTFSATGHCPVSERSFGGGVYRSLAEVPIDALTFGDEMSWPSS